MARLAKALAGKSAGPPRPEPRPALAQVVDQVGIAANRGGEHRQDQDRALRDRAVIGRDVQDEQDIDDDHQDVGAEHRAREPAAAAAEAGPADHDGGEDLEQHGIADQRVAAAGLGADEHAGQPI